MRNLGRTSLRLSLQFAFLYSVLAAVIFVLAYWATEFEVRNLLTEQMNSDAETLRKLYEADGIDAVRASVDTLSKINFENERIFRLSAADGSVLAGNITEIAVPPSDAFVPADKVAAVGGLSDEIFGYWITQRNLGPNTLLLGTGDHVISEVLEALGLSLMAGFFVILAFGTLVGVWVGRLTESRIEAISAAMEQVAEGSLSARVPIEAASNDDLSRVAVSINDTLEKLESVMESQRQISNDIAHDMRTPLQRLRQRLEKMSGQSVIDPQDAERALSQTEDLISTFNALLRIAQIEAGERRAKFRATDLGRLASNVQEVFEPSAEDGGCQLLLRVPDQPVSVIGDPDLLTQLLSNLVENALRHTPAGTTIEIEVSQADTGPILAVSDTGPGIAPEDREKVLRRFFRGEKSRTSGGNGLGLSLCQAVAGLHHAQLEILDNNPGTRIEVHFPSRHQ